MGGNHRPNALFCRGLLRGRHSTLRMLTEANRQGPIAREADDTRFIAALPFQTILLQDDFASSTVLANASARIVMSKR